jgi:hypothetical protein
MARKCGLPWEDEVGVTDGSSHGAELICGARNMPFITISLDSLTILRETLSHFLLAGADFGDFAAWAEVKSKRCG